ncbi:MAG: dihydroorotase [Gammaproteobacteria bacterium]
MSIEIKNGRLLDPANDLDKKANLYIDKGRIVAIGKKPAGFNASKTIDASGQVVIPGLVDLCVRTREPGFEYKATMDTELRAASKSGITSLCSPPDSDPVVDSPAVVRLIQQRASEVGHARVYTLGAITKGLKGEQLAEMGALQNAGCIAVSNALQPIRNSEVLRRAFEYAHSCGLTVFIQPNDSDLQNNGVANEGAISTRLGLPPVPETAETVALARALLLIEQTGVRAHFCRISSARSVSMIRQAQQEGWPVTADVDICHLHLTDMDIANYNVDCHLQPPLKTERDRSALVRGIEDGVITAICSDHQPHDRDAKSAPFSLTEAGASTVELLLPLVLHLVEGKQLSLPQAIAAVTSRPATILGLDAGTLAKGVPADLCIVDLDNPWQVERERLLSMGKNTPFHGWNLSACVSTTIMNGKVTYKRKA